MYENEVAPWRLISCQKPDALNLRPRARQAPAATVAPQDTVSALL